METKPNHLKWCVVKLRHKKTGNTFYDFSKYGELDLLREQYNVVVLASFCDYDLCIAKVLELEKKAEARRND